MNVRVPRGGWTSVSIPDELVDRIDEFVDKEGQEWAYRSRPDVITDAVRRFLREWEQKEAASREENGGNNESTETERRA